MRTCNLDMDFLSAGRRAVTLSRCAVVSGRGLGAHNSATSGTRLDTHTHNDTLPLRSPLSESRLLGGGKRSLLQPNWISRSGTKVHTTVGDARNYTTVPSVFESVQRELDRSDGPRPERLVHNLSSMGRLALTSPELLDRCRSELNASTTKLLAHKDIDSKDLNKPLQVAFVACTLNGVGVGAWRHDIFKQLLQNTRDGEADQLITELLRAGLTISDSVSDVYHSVFRAGLWEHNSTDNDNDDNDFLFYNGDLTLRDSLTTVLDAATKADDVDLTIHLLRTTSNRDYRPHIDITNTLQRWHSLKLLTASSFCDIITAIRFPEFSRHELIELLEISQSLADDGDDGANTSASIAVLQTIFTGVGTVKHVITQSMLQDILNGGNRSLGSVSVDDAFLLAIAMARAGRSEALRYIIHLFLRSEDRSDTLAPRSVALIHDTANHCQGTSAFDLLFGLMERFPEDAALANDDVINSVFKRCIVDNDVTTAQRLWGVCLSRVQQTKTTDITSGVWRDWKSAVILSCSEQNTNKQTVNEICTHLENDNDSSLDSTELSLNSEAYANLVQLFIRHRAHNDVTANDVSELEHLLQSFKSSFPSTMDLDLNTTTTHTHETASSLPHYVKMPNYDSQTNNETAMGKIMIAASIAPPQILSLITSEIDSHLSGASVRTPAGVGACCVTYLRSGELEEAKELILQHSSSTLSSNDAKESMLGFVLAKAVLLDDGETVCQQAFSLVQDMANEIKSTKGNTGNSSNKTRSFMPKGDFATTSTQEQANFVTGVAIRACNEISHHRDYSRYAEPIIRLVHGFREAKLPLRDVAYIKMFSIAEKCCPSPDFIDLILGFKESGIDLSENFKIKSMILNTVSREGRFNQALQFVRSLQRDAQQHNQSPSPQKYQQQQQQQQHQQQHQQKQGRQQQQQPDVRMFNSVFQSIQTASQLTKTQDILRMMHSSNVEPNARTYAILTYKHFDLTNAKSMLHVFFKAVLEVNIDLDVRSATSMIGIANKLGAEGYADVLALDEKVTCSMRLKDQIYLTQVLLAHVSAVFRAFTATEVEYAWQGREAVVAEAAGAVEHAIECFDALVDAAIKPSHFNLQCMLSVAEQTGDVDLAERIWSMMDTTGIDQNENAFRKIIAAHGRVGDIRKMLEYFSEFEKRGYDTDLTMITNLIYYCGLAQDIEAAMEVYDRMLELRFKPDDKLNNVLIHVCNIDPISVLWNT